MKNGEFFWKCRLSAENNVVKHTHATFIQMTNPSGFGTFGTTFCPKLASETWEILETGDYGQSSV